MTYDHLLIPHRNDFVPNPSQVVAFLDELQSMGAAPNGPTIRLGRHLGRRRTGRHPMTGEQISIAVRDYSEVADNSRLASQLAGIDDYDVIVEGQGPPKLPPFELYTFADSVEQRFEETYVYHIGCQLRKEPLTLPVEEPLGTSGEPRSTIGRFNHPNTGDVVEIANAGSARFWITFGFGNFLYPKLGENLTGLQPAMVETAKSAFGVGFAEGCRFG